MAGRQAVHALILLRAQVRCLPRLACRAHPCNVVDRFLFH